MKKQIIPIIQRTYDKDKYRDLLRRPFAHRGVHGEYPENSKPAFEKAVKMNLGIELDIHITKDNKLVVFHDDNLKRMTGEDEYIKFLTYEQIKSYKLKDGEYTIPLLNEVLKTVKGRVPILIEIKTNNDMKRLVPQLKQELESYEGAVFIQSFNPFVLRRAEINERYSKNISYFFLVPNYAKNKFLINGNGCIQGTLYSEKYKCITYCDIMENVFKKALEFLNNN